MPGFNPRPRTGSDYKGRFKQDGLLVSIHAPARGATMVLFGSLGQVPVSIHAPARGATGRARQRGVADVVSIHAPARGATRWRPLCHLAYAVSIHAPARGATATSGKLTGETTSFNPRPRTGSDRQGYTDLVSEEWVSIHAPARGATSGSGSGLPCSPVSIHAPARGATLTSIRVRIPHVWFQSTPPHGERLYMSALPPILN